MSKKGKAKCDLPDELRCRPGDNIIMSKKGKAKCDLPDELRCNRGDNKTWRCSKRRADNCRYCEHHRETFHRNYQNRKDKKAGLIGITKHCMSNKYKIRETEIAEKLRLPGNILGMADLTNVLNMETWIQHLTPAERSNLCAFLPNVEEQDKTSVVESLLSGQNLNFGNPAMKWGKSVCTGKQFPDALLEREQELKHSQKQYFKDLKAYHDTYIKSVEELKKLCESCDGFNGDDRKFREALEQRRTKELRDQRK